MVETELSDRRQIVQRWHDIAPWIRWVAVSTVVVLVVAAAIIFLPSWFRNCDPGLTETDDSQCVGVSDGTASISPELTDVLGKIRAENARIVTLPIAAVSVAILVPIPRPGTDTDFAATLRHDIEGAHLAQLAANRTTVFGDSPPVRLLVANSGAESIHWQDAVLPLLEMKPGGSGDRRLGAVVASGRSLLAPRKATDTLLAGSIPVVSDR
ncbi:MAG: hypothetical protein ACR2GH_07020, partial [Pseudonocardia sp.]